MCGIAGIWNFDKEPVDSELLLKAVNSMEKRGPDDFGLEIDLNVGFGHRRLSIIDLSPLGHQPMLDEDKNAMIVFNGEIYNYLELRKELEEEGVNFKSKSDTEVLLKGYIQWGSKKLFSKCRGMWALAIWDKKNKKIILSRDRFGKKPLFYSIENKKLIFASTLNALMILGRDKREIDKEAIHFYLNFGYIPPDKVVFKGYKKCQPSTFLEIYEDGTIKEERYWEVKFSEEKNLTVEDWKEKIGNLLKEAVKYRLIADVPVSSFLSGGIDSTFIVATAIELGYKPKVFTMSSPNSWMDERKRAEIFAKKYGLEHIIIPLDESCYKVLPFLIKEFGEPYGDSSAIPAYYIASEASKETKVILTGDGGDEIFSGYGRLDFTNRYHKLNNFLPKFLKPLFYNIGNFLNNYYLFPRCETIGGRLKILSGNLNDYFDFWWKIPFWMRKKLYGYELNKNGFNYNPFEEKLKIFNYNEWIKNVLKMDIEINLVGDFLAKMDIACMSSSLEARCPMLDHILAEEVFKMPLDIWQYNNEPKGFLKLLAKDKIPEEIIKAPKYGFSIPVQDYWEAGWFKIFEEIVLSGILINDGWLNKKEILKIWRDFKFLRKNKENSLLYYILCLELWFRIIVKGNSPENYVF